MRAKTLLICLFLISLLHRIESVSIDPDSSIGHVGSSLYTSGNSSITVNTDIDDMFLFKFDDSNWPSCDEDDLTYFEINLCLEDANFPLPFLVPMFTSYEEWDSGSVDGSIELHALNGVVFENIGDCETMHIHLDLDESDRDYITLVIKNDRSYSDSGYFTIDISTISLEVICDERDRCSFEDTCNSNGDCVFDFVPSDQSPCSCYSGYSGDFCDTEGTCDSWLNVSTDFIPDTAIPVSRVTSDGEFQLSFSTPFVHDRRSLSLRAGSFGIGLEQQCAYPNSTYWTHTQSECFDTFSFNAPWTVARRCGFVYTSSEIEETYESTLIARFRDPVTTNNDAVVISTSEKSKPIYFSIRTNIRVTSQVTFSGDPNLDLFAAMTKQASPIMLLNQRSDGSIELVTIVNEPYILDTPQIEGPNSLLTNITGEDIDCLDSGECQQKWIIDIDPQDACTIAGIYNIDYNADCRNATGCNISSPVVLIDALVASDNYCTEVTLDIGLSGTLKPYNDENFKSASGAFYVDSRSYFKAEVVSEGNLRFESSTITQVTVNGQVLFEDSEITELGNTLEFSVDDGGSDWAGFSFIVDSSLVPEDLGTEFATLVVSASIDVEYKGSVANKKRALFVDARSTTGSSEISVGIDQTRVVYKIPPWLIAIIIAGTVIGVALVIFAGVKLSNRFMSNRKTVRARAGTMNERFARYGIGRNEKIRNNTGDNNEVTPITPRQKDIVRRGRKIEDEKQVLKRLETRSTMSKEEKRDLQRRKKLLKNKEKLLLMDIRTEEENTGASFGWNESMEHSSTESS
eukprot:TRINITY_DN11602_c0_g1_i1.p1 TRINITY_DN11602_c0_g1~~TRINITY_DN11602_c0_g1_i1.p1  ORF type:complete len:800 (-),score=192.40 TRINITY_DN11602_c0_g1_i1:47-2446(-)